MTTYEIYAVANDRSQAEKLIEILIESGISHKQISFLSQQNQEFPEFARENELQQPFKGRNWRTEERLTNYPIGKVEKEEHPEKSHPLQKLHHTKSQEGATAGAATGGLIGGTLGLLAGIGVLAIPGLGPFIAAGPLLATLSGIGAGGTIGGIIGTFMGSGIPEFKAKYYEDLLMKGAVLVIIQTPSESDAITIKEFLKQNGAHNVSINTENDHLSQNL